MLIISEVSYESFCVYFVKICQGGDETEGNTIEGWGEMMGMN